MQFVFDFSGTDLEAGCIDHPLQPIRHEEIVLLVAVGDSARAQIPDPRYLGERQRCVRRALPITLENLWFPYEQFAALPPGP